MRRSLVWAGTACGVITLVIAGIAWLKQAGIVVEIRPDKRVWRPGETVTGTVTIRNRSWREARLEPSQNEALSSLVLIDERGEQPPTFPSRLKYCGLTSEVTRVLDPWAEGRDNFRLVTDPLTGFSGQLATDGRFKLAANPREVVCNVPVQLRSAIIEFQSGNGHRVGKRIIRFAAGGSRLNVLREDGLLESFDLEGGRRLAAVQIEADVIAARWSASFSPDGERFAITRTGPEPWQDELVVYQVTSGRHEKVLSPISDRHHYAFLIHSSHLLVIDDEAILKLDLDARLIHTMLKLKPQKFARLSPDERFLVSWEDEVPSVAPMTGGRPRQVLPPGDPDSCTHLLGNRGIYLASGGPGGTLFESYDGAMRRVLPSRAQVALSESQDGGRVALSTASRYDFTTRKAPGSLEVWDVDAGRKLYEIQDGNQREAAFASSGLVCAIMIRGDWRAWWFSDTFEVRDPTTGELLKTLTLSAD